MLIGVITLKERLNTIQILSFSLAGVGVFVLTIHYGVIPWILLSFNIWFLWVVKENDKSGFNDWISAWNDGHFPYCARLFTVLDG